MKKKTMKPSSSEMKQQFLRKLNLHQQFLQQERNIERDWNEITSVCLTLQFPEIDAAIGKAQIDLIGREKSFFDLERFNASLYAADSTLMADTKTAKLSYGACDGPCIEFPFWYIEDCAPGIYNLIIQDADDDSMLVIEFSLGDDDYPTHSFVWRDNETEEVDVRFHLYTHGETAGWPEKL